MIKKESVTKNLSFQLLYQIIIMVIPLIQAPYLTRTLQETALGTYSYVHSIAYYFLVFANLGISRHGQRIIAQNREDENKLRKVFWSLFSVHAIVVVIIVILYLLFVGIIVKVDRLIYYIEGFYVLSALFDITWLFYGLENFKNVVIRNLTIKVIQFMLIFLFVKTPDDLLLYTLVCSVGILVGQIVMLPQAFKIIRPIKFKISDMTIHIKPLLIFTIAIVASTLYTTFDMTLLGLMSNKENVAFYDYANQIICVPRTIVGVIGTVMFPRACALAAKGDIVGQKKYIKYSVAFVSIISFGAIFGILAVANLFAYIYYGASFVACGPVMMSLAPVIFIVGLGDVIRTQYMIPNKMDKQFTICILLNAVVNLILSISLIPIIGIYGAVIGTVSAECFGLIYQLILCKKFISISEVGRDVLPYAIIGFVMYIALLFVKTFLGDNFISLFIQIISGVLIYLLLSAIYMFSQKEMFGDIKCMVKNHINRKE